MKKLLATAVLTLSMVLGFSAAAFAAPNDQIVGTDPTDGTNVETRVQGDVANDNEINNANLSGVGVGGQDPATFPETKFQSVEGQRTHGEYQNNTNSCASCHQTHTAAASDLLFKDGVFETCTACHDGTLGVFNVYAPSTAGTFGGTTAGNASIHMPSGSVDVKAAPGGNSTVAADSDTFTSVWNAEFNCASCHSPHGSYSDRLLKFNPNSVGSTDMYFRATDGSFTDKDGAPSATPVSTGGLKVVGAPVVDTLVAAAETPEYVVYRTTADSTTLDKPVTTEAAGTKVIVLMKKNAKKNADGTYTYTFTREMNPWIGNGYNTRGTSGMDEMTNFYKTYTWGDTTNNIKKANLAKFSVNPTVNTDDEIIVKFGYAYIIDGPATGDGLDAVKFADISRSIPVKLNFLPTPKATYNGVDILEVDTNSYNNAQGTMGVAISQYCAACHTDYFVSAGTDESGKGKGVWSKAFRHNTTSNSYTCLKCHFAHGTDVSVMLDAQDRSVETLVTEGVFADTAAATNYMLDKNNSSALKRYTNMAVCWKCHTSSHSEDLRNNQWVQGVNPGLNTSSEYNLTGDDLPGGWVAPVQSTLPYAGNDNVPTTPVE